MSARKRSAPRTTARSLGSAAAGAALALVHCLHARDRYLLTFIDQNRAEDLGRGRQVLPGGPLLQQAWRCVQGEILGRDLVELVPGQRKGDRHTGPDARAVGGHHGGAARARRVKEHTPAAVLLHKSGGGEVGGEALGT